MDFKLKQRHLWMADTTRGQVEVDFYLPSTWSLPTFYLSSDFKQFHPWMADTTRRQVEELPCSQILPAFSILQFLSLTRKPGFQSSWNRKLVNFDFWIFFDEKFFFDKIFLVKNYKISDFVDSFCSKTSHYYTLIFSLHGRGRLEV